MPRPSVTERHVARTYRSLFLRAQDWTIQASGGTIGSGYLQLTVGESAALHFVPPYDLDPSFALKFRAHIHSQAAATRTVTLTVAISNNDNTDLGYEFDMTHDVAITTPIPAKVITAPTGKTITTAAGSLTLPSTTKRNWSMGMKLVTDGALLIYGLEVAYVPLIAGVTGYPSDVGTAWSV